MLYPGSRFKMAYALLERYTEQLIAALRVPEVTFAWQGGEPTLRGLELLQEHGVTFNILTTLHRQRALSGEGLPLFARRGGDAVYPAYPHRRTG